MKQKSHSRKTLAGLTLAVAIGASFHQSLAQEAVAPAINSLDTMIVTGSSIPTAEEIGSSPVDVLTTETIQRTGVSDVLEVLRKSNPSFVGGGNLGSSNANINSGSTYGGSAISLRDLPTLVLLDGRRIADSSAAAGGGSVFTDVNLFPTSMIERIEVLKDGASAIYGSEAIGGVVNIILKKNFEGFEAGYHFGFAGEKNSEGEYITDHRVHAIFGTTTEKLRLVIGGQYIEQDPVYTRDRSVGVPNYGTTNYRGNIVDVDGNFYQVAPGITKPNGNYKSSDYVPASFDTVLNGFDLSRATTATLEQRKFNFFANAEYDVLENNAMTVFGSFLYSQNFSRSQLNAQPVNTSGVIIPADSPSNPYGVVIDANADISVRNRYVNHPRIFQQDTDFYRVLGGLKGSFFEGKLNYETAYNISENAINYKNSNLILQQGINDAIASGQLNFFTPGDLVTEKELKGVFGTDFQDLKSQQRIFDFKLNGFPLELPAGSLGVAAGFEYRQENLKAATGPNIFLDSVPIDFIDVARDITSFYAETSIPIIGGPVTYPGIYRLEATAAFRYESYSDAGESTVPKFGITYQPIKDVLFRGTFSQSFIAPTLYQVSGPTSIGFTPSGITLNGNPQDQAHSLSGSNPSLQPSTADNYNFGVVITPRFVPGLKVSVDYFNIKQEGLIDVLSAQTVLSSVEALGQASPFAKFVSKGSFGGPGVSGPGQLDGKLNDVYVSLNQQNLGGQKVAGFDTDIQYRIELGKQGAITLGASAIYFTSYEYQELPMGKFVDLAGINKDGNSNLPQYRIASFISYELGGLKADINFNYQPETDNGIPFAIADFPTSKFPKIAEYYTFDTRLSYEFGKNKAEEPATAASYGKDGKEIAAAVPSVRKTSLLDGLSVSAGVNNIFDRKPSFISDGATDNTDLAAFDITGRYFYFEVTKKF